MIAVEEISSKSINIQSIMYVITNMNKANVNTKVNQNYLVTVNRKSQGQGHTERFQLTRSDQGL